MNERIKEIASQAKLEHCVSHDRLEEFAHLIINSCALKANAVSIDLTLYKNLNARTYVGDSILKVFGIENER